MQLRESIEEIVQNLISDEYFIIDVSVAGSGGRPKITVLLDGDNGITIDICAKISRTLGEEIEKRELIDNNYVLEVSSPGIDHPLMFSRQYQRNVGRKLSLVLNDDKNYTGTLLEVKSNSIILEAEVPMLNKEGKVLKNKKTFQEMEIPFSKIKKTNVIISFS